MPQYAEDTDICDIQKLFNECFPEDIRFNQWFFENKLRIEDTVVYKINGKIAGMLIRMPQMIEGLGIATYIYGACTKNEFRRQGIMSEMLEFSHNEDMKLGVVCSTLIPAEEWLFEFYAQYGYKVSGYLESIYCNVKWKENSFRLRQIEKKDISVIDNIYRGALVNKKYVVRNKEYWCDLLSMFEELDGEALLITENENALGYALLWKGEEPFIQELCCVDEECRDNIISEIMKRLDTGNIKVTSIRDKTTKPFAMAKVYGNDSDMEIYENMLWN